MQSHDDQISIRRELPRRPLRSGRELGVSVHPRGLNLFGLKRDDG
jgi:hypothetical protein